MNSLLWLKRLLAALALATPIIALLGWWLGYQNGAPTYGPSWLTGGIGFFFMVTTWACYVESLIQQRFVSGVPLFGNIALALALLMGPKPWLSILAFVLDPYTWGYIYMLFTKKYKKGIYQNE